ncbi:hypothetical protein E3N88_45426 [Mikania micrantha]|uniref:Uncharacterized protein n=1 Tax=Mikania micrantha TaxID=192012 RepID=A0A5N6L9U7_9ASTR|nr:hypothetical protein E3N88_45426 [Mikania micrantha]
MVWTWVSSVGVAMMEGRGWGHDELRLLTLACHTVWKDEFAGVMMSWEMVVALMELDSMQVLKSSVLTSMIEEDDPHETKFRMMKMNTEEVSREFFMFCETVRGRGATGEGLRRWLLVGEIRSGRWSRWTTWLPVQACSGACGCLAER